MAAYLNKARFFSVGLSIMTMVGSSLVAEPVLKIADHSAEARIFFRRNEYQRALLALENHPAKGDDLWIIAESHFKLRNYSLALDYYNKLASQLKSVSDKKKVAIRLFDIAIKTADLDLAKKLFADFIKQFKIAPLKSRYVLAKALFDKGYSKEAEDLLKQIPKNSEFVIRAKYIMATIELAKNNIKGALKGFKEIQNLSPISVEDYSVLPLSILAEARIYYQSKYYDLAITAYKRVDLEGKWAEVASIELVRTLLLQADEARIALGPYKKMTQKQREAIENNAVLEAAKAFERYRHKREVSVEQIELSTLMAQVYAYNKRYLEARKIYNDIISHYRLIYLDLNTSNDQLDNEVWPYFMLNKTTVKHISILPGVANALFDKLPRLNEIILLKENIEKNKQKLTDLEERTIFMEKNKDFLTKYKNDYETLETSYAKVVINEQRELKREIAKIINKTIAETEFNLAQVSILEMNELKKQLDETRKYQSQEMNLFEKSLLEENNKGGSL